MVTKRNGAREPLTLEKWQSHVAQICNELTVELTEPSQMEYYVYVYYREKTSKYGEAGSPYYIGIGKNKRAWTKGKNEVRKPLKEHLIVIEKSNISENTAKKIEIALINYFGRIDIGTGILRNKTNGGDGNQMIGEKNPMYGKTRELHHMFGKIRHDMIGKNNPMYGIKGEMHPAYGYKHSDEDRELIRLSKLGIKRINFDQSGSKNPMFGRTGVSNPNYGKKYQKKECSYCGVMASNGMFTRWHSDGKCQHKNNG